jgi:outer membrane protein assembly factor BamB
VLFRYPFEPSARLPLTSSPLVLPDGSILAVLDASEGLVSSSDSWRQEAGRGFATAIDPAGRELWRTELLRAGPPGTLVATGELVVEGNACIQRIDPRTGRVLESPPVRAAPLRSDEADEGEVTARGRPGRARPAAWEEHVLVREWAVGRAAASSLTRDGQSLLVRAAPVTSEDGRAYLLVQAYAMSPSGRYGFELPDIQVYPPEVLAFDREGEIVWRAPVPERRMAPILVAGRRALHVLVEGERLVLDRATGKLLATEPAPVPYLALDPNDEPVPLAPFGPPLASPPVVDAAGRRYAGTRRGTIVGLGPSNELLFEVTVAEPARSPVVGGADGRLAIGPGRLYLISGSELVAIGNE